MKRYIKLLGALTASAALIVGCTGISGEHNSSEVEAQTPKPDDTNGDDMEASAVEPADIPYDDYEAWNALLSENDISEEFRDSLSRFAFDSGSAVLSGEDGNAVFSPVSLYYALSILGTGASGKTEAEILEALGVSDKAELSDQCARLYRRYAYTREREKLLADEYGEEPSDSAISLADSLWISDDITLRPEYQDICAKDFYTSSYHVDFKDGETAKRMGQWISDRTEGVLAPEIELSPDTVLAIINTLYFYGGWQYSFNEGLTEEDDFTLRDGSEVTVPFMNRTDETRGFIRGDGYTLSGLSTNNNWEVLFLLPDEGTDINTFINDSERLGEVFAETEGKWRTGRVIWKIPKFSFGSSFDLKEALMSMGMESMYDSLKAEFSDMSEDPLYVDRTIQEAHIGVDEEGVEGAAYTMIAVAGSSAMPQEEPEIVRMTLDRPFLFAVHDYRNDVWLFLGICADPSANQH